MIYISLICIWIFTSKSVEFILIHFIPSSVDCLLRPKIHIDRHIIMCLTTFIIIYSYVSSFEKYVCDGFATGKQMVQHVRKMQRILNLVYFCNWFRCLRYSVEVFFCWFIRMHAWYYINYAHWPDVIHFFFALFILT